MGESDAGRAAGRRSPRAAVTRRRVITSGVTSAAAVAGTVAALHPMLTARQPSGPAGLVAAGGPAGADGSGGDIEAAPARPVALFDEVYRGRRIQGFTDPGEDGVAITVDGEALPVMRRVDGSWISTANHYQPYTTPLATARAAVDVIGRAKLSAAFAQLHHHDAYHH